MVFKKNMRHQVLFILLYLFLSSCTQKKIIEKKNNVESFKNIQLNVEELIVEILENKLDNIDDEIIFIRNHTASRLEDWGSKKFLVKGKKDQAILRILSPYVILKETKHSRGLKKLFLYNKKIYLIKTKLELRLISSDNTLTKLDIDAKIDFEIDDNMSLNNKNIEIGKKVENLIETIDIEIDKQLSKINFESFIF